LRKLGEEREKLKWITTDILIVAFALVIFGLLSACGVEPSYIDARTPKGSLIQQLRGIEWKVVGTARLSVRSLPGLGAIPVADTTINYTVPDAKQFDVDVSAVVPAPDEVGSTLALGTLTIDKIKVTKLKVCGVGEDEKCTIAAIRIYTTDTAGHPGVSGFVNTDEGYGVPILAGEGTATELVGMSGAEAVLDSYSIPASDKRLTGSDFGSMVYVIESDMSNAGFGNYQAEITIDLVVGIE
jgi:hypothetical protein